MASRLHLTINTSKEINAMSLKAAKCERTGHPILLSDGFLVANAATGDWSFLILDAEE